MVNKRFAERITPMKESKTTEEQVFELAKDHQSSVLCTPDNTKNYRARRYDSNYSFEKRFSTPIEGSKRFSLNPTSNSPYNHYSFSSSEAMWKLRLKASEASIIPYENRQFSDKKSSVSPIRLKDDLINIESIKEQMKARQQVYKSAGKFSSVSKPDLSAERQISDPKKLLDEFMLPHATIMACGK